MEKFQRKDAKKKSSRMIRKRSDRRKTGGRGRKKKKKRRRKRKRRNRSDGEGSEV